MKIIEIYFNNLNMKIKYYIGKNEQDNFNIIDINNKDIEINNKDNYINKDTAIWFHIKNDSSCHVIASIPNELQNKNINCIIKYGGQLCKHNTNKYKSVKGSVEIIWTQLKNVKKTETIGTVFVFTC